eukprot:TRINITY_DN4627_c0_g2_i1.p1 TRINITY_DN4627_c0_g2~~TRINITY_DN4627_c0_g2_i1.p1  ORF type:complete len:258 (-),score=28.91 TRINITY_DN4627_c0_g2_i1:132-905(-)
MDSTLISSGYLNTVAFLQRLIIYFWVTMSIGVNNPLRVFAYYQLIKQNTLKIFFLLRGNHECSAINRIYGFYDECKRRFSVKIWKQFTECFNCLPVVAIVDEKIICMHGGLSPELTNLEQIHRIMRPLEVPDQGLLCDLVWSDPELEVTGWMDSERGVSYVFGPDVISSFLKKNDMDLICRAHQVVEDGYEFFAKRQLVTIFSAPNYCGEFDNSGALMSVDESLMCSFQILKPYDKKTQQQKTSERKITPPKKRLSN